MALLPTEQDKQLKLLVAILAVAGAALYYLYVHRPRADELLEERARVESLQAQNEAAEARIGNLQELRDRLAAAESQLEALERLVPSGAEVPEIYESIATETQALRLRLISVEPAEPVPTDSASPLLRQEWLMRVEGEYHALGTLLARVASFDRIVRPRVTEVIPSGMTPAGRQLVNATFSLETFVLRGGAPPTGEEAAGFVAGADAGPGSTGGSR
ncbi:MAG: type 4a pilus biogenesis protein PilO [Gemmatimonadota bacterium]|nr:type 4a pilus biogenesis protein PilO [Gemmatimonadota bacterium]